jgi:dipeptidyl aminopeptidase/acylaminoacyl peptidase
VITSILYNDLKLSCIVEQPLSDGPYPAVFLLHGNTGWKEETHLETLSKSLVDKGFVVVRFDSPGSGESEGTWADDYRATNYIEATKVVYDWVIANVEVDTERVGIWGHSMGGMVAVQVVARWPELFFALCGSQPSTGKASQTDSWHKDGGFLMKTQIFGGVWLPAAFYEDRLQYDTAKTVKRLHLPQLYIAGTKDTLVPQKAVENIFANANEPKQLEIFKTDHFYKDNEEKLAQINTATASFFKESLHN